MPLTDDNEIRALLERVRRIAVIGLSAKPDRPSHDVARALKHYGYEIVPVNPNEDTVLDERAYGQLEDLSRTVDLVDVFRRPEHVPDIVDTCIRSGIGAIWLQEGVRDEAAARRAEQAGIDVVVDRCIYKEYRRLRGA